MKEFSQNQEAQLRYIADHLRRVRTEQGISLDEIAVKTFIPLRLLQAVDDVQIDRLPEPVFVQGFIRRYADAIGVDGLAVARSFPLETPTVEQKPVEQKPVEPAIANPSMVEKVEQPTQGTLPRQTGNSEQFPKLPLYWLGGIALLLGLGALAFWNRPQPVATSPPTESGTVSTGASQPPVVAPIEPPAAPSPLPSAMPSPTVAASPTIPAAPVQVVVNVTGEKSWLLVEADGKQAFEGMVKKGDQKTWTAQKQLFLRAGDAGAVSVSYNQEKEARLGAPGEIQEVTYTTTGKGPAAP